MYQDLSTRHDWSVKKANQLEGKFKTHFPVIRCVRYLPGIDYACDEALRSELQLTFRHRKMCDEVLTVVTYDARTKLILV